MGFPQDRFSLAMSLGVSLALAGLIDWPGKDLPRKAAVLALASGWRPAFTSTPPGPMTATGIRPRFLLAAHLARAVGRAQYALCHVEMPFQYFEDDSLTAPLNWTYDPDGTLGADRYLLYDLDVRRNPCRL
jgi:hypothetical protein